MNDKGRYRAARADKNIVTNVNEFRKMKVRAVGTSQRSPAGANF